MCITHNQDTLCINISILCDLLFYIVLSDKYYYSQSEIHICNENMSLLKCKGRRRENPISS